jgi:hypothetical protein
MMKRPVTSRSSLRTLACAALLMGGLASSGLAQNPNVSPSGTYQAALACSGGGLRWHRGLLQVWDGANQALPTIEMSCDGIYEVASGAMRMHYMLLVVDTAGVTLRQCENPSTSTIKQGRFNCKAGKVSVTLNIEPK